MYAQFGGLVNQADRTASFTLFFPDATGAPSQCEGGRLPRVRVPEDDPWQDLISGAMVTPENGWLRSTVGSNWGGDRLSAGLIRGPVDRQRSSALNGNAPRPQSRVPE